MEDRDKMIAKLVHDNETLMGEIQGLQHALHRMQQEKEALEASAVVGQRLLDTVTEQSQLDRREREAAAAAARRDYEALMEQHEADKDFLNTVFRELEAQLAVTRAEREETQSRAERERRASQPVASARPCLEHSRSRRLSLPRTAPASSGSYQGLAQVEQPEAQHAINASQSSLATRSTQRETHGCPDKRRRRESPARRDARALSCDAVADGEDPRTIRR